MAGPIIEILEQHAEEAALLWLLRDRAIRASNYYLPDLTELDGRVEAHLDGLRVGGDAAWELCTNGLKWNEPGEAFTAAHIAFLSEHDDRGEEVLEAATRSGELVCGVISALGWLPYTLAHNHISVFVESAEPTRRWIGIAAAAIHRRDQGSAIIQALSDSDSRVRTRALRAAGELGRTDLVGVCRESFEEDAEEIRFWAAWSAALLGDTSCTSVLRGVAGGEGPFAQEACDTLGRCLDHPRALEWQEQLKEAGNTALAVTAARALGDPAGVPFLIEAMRIDKLARPAGEAVSDITGVDLANNDLVRGRPEDFVSGPTEDPEDEDVSMDPHEDLPWPDPELVASWWSENGTQFTSGARYTAGLPLEEESLSGVLVTGNQRQRRAAAFEIVLQQPGQPLFETRARGDRQRRALCDLR